MTEYLLAHKIALRPNRKQATMMRKSAGVARFAYNWGLAKWNEMYDAHKADPSQPKPDWQKLSKIWNSVKIQQFPWVSEVHSQIPTRAFANLGQSFSRYFSKLGKRPTFKSKRDQASFYLHNATFSFVEKRSTDDQAGKFLRISKFGTQLGDKHHAYIRMTEMPRFVGKVMAGSISESGGQWFLSVQTECVEAQFAAPSPKDSAVGVDLGCRDMATLSTGEKIANPRHLYAAERRLRIRQRRLSRKEEAHKIVEKAQGKKVKRGSSWRKAQAAVAKIHTKVRNQRADTQHKMTSAIAANYATVGIETLRVKNMMKNRRLAKSIGSVGMYEIRRQLEYKVPRHGGRVVLADTWFASSKNCSACGTKNTKLKMQSEWTCDACGTHHDRDINAAINLREHALQVLRDESSSPPVAAKKAAKSLVPKRKLSKPMPAQTSVASEEISTAAPAESNAMLVERISLTPSGGVEQCSEVEAGRGAKAKRKSCRKTTQSSQQSLFGTG